MEAGRDCEAAGGDWTLDITCTEQDTPPDICANIVNISIDNCIQVGTGDSPCASIENVQQQNTCCREGWLVDWAGWFASWHCRLSGVGG